MTDRCPHHTVAWHDKESGWWCIDCGERDLVVVEGPPVTNEELRRLIAERRQNRPEDERG